MSLLPPLRETPALPLGPAIALVVVLTRLLVAVALGMCTHLASYASRVMDTCSCEPVRAQYLKESTALQRRGAPSAFAVPLCKKGSFSQATPLGVPYSPFEGHTKAQVAG